MIAEDPDTSKRAIHYELLPGKITAGCDVGQHSITFLDQSRELLLYRQRISSDPRWPTFSINRLICLAFYFWKIVCVLRALRKSTCDIDVCLGNFTFHNSTL